MTRHTEALRALRRLRTKHTAEFIAYDQFERADYSICPELWRREEPLFNSSGCPLDDTLLLAVARRFGINPTELDDAAWGAYHEEQDRWMHALLNRATREHRRVPAVQKVETRHACHNTLNLRYNASDTHVCTPEGAMQ